MDLLSFLGGQVYLRLIYIPHSHKFLKLQCLWNSVEHIVGDLSPPVSGTLRQVEQRINFGCVLNPLFNSSLCSLPGKGETNLHILVCIKSPNHFTEAKIVIIIYIYIFF